MQRKTVPITCKVCGVIDHRGKNSVYCRDCVPGKYIPLKDRPTRHCSTCKKVLNDECTTTQSLMSRKFCFACSQERQKSYRRNRPGNRLNDNEAARQLTKYAVKIGFLLHPSNYICMDCKRRQAECYDHRDYSKPLDVDAVCLPCNSSRGRGIPLHLVKPKTAAA